MTIDAVLNSLGSHSFQLFVMACLAVFVELAARELLDMPAEKTVRARSWPR